MKSKKLLVVIAALSLIIALAACGGVSNNSSEPSALSSATESATSGSNTVEPSASEEQFLPEPDAKLLIWDGGQERPFAEEIAKRFQEKYNIEVKVEELGPPDTVNQLITDGPAGIAADVFVMPHNHLGRAVVAGLVLPNDVFGEETTNENTESAIVGATYEGVLYGYPRSAETYALYYNKKYVQTAPQSFDDVIAFGKTFTDKDKNKYGLMWEAGNFYFTYPFFSSGGGYVFGKDGTDKEDIGLNNAGAVEGLNVFASLRPILPVNTGDINPDIKRTTFKDGNAAMDINGPWELAGYKTALGDDLGIAPIPTINGKTPISFAGIQEYAVNAYTKYPKAAKLFAHFATSKEAQLLLFEKIGGVPTNKEAQNDPLIKDDPYISGFVEQSKNSQPMPAIPEMEAVWGPVGAALGDIWNQGKDPKSSMDNAVNQIKDAIAGSQ